MNVTLLFSVERYARGDRGVPRRAWSGGCERGSRSGPIASVASFFVSRVDGKVDPLLDGRSTRGLRGRIAIANACAAYRLFEWSLGTPRWDRLAKAGARPQRPLWASTSTKDPRYPDIYYVEALVAPAHRQHPAARDLRRLPRPRPPRGPDPRGHRGGHRPAAGAGRARHRPRRRSPGSWRRTAWPSSRRRTRSLLAGIEAKAGELAGTLSDARCGAPCAGSRSPTGSSSAWAPASWSAGSTTSRPTGISPPVLKPLSTDLPPDDQVDRGAAHLRHAGDRHRGPRRRPQAHRPARAQVDRLLLDHDDVALGDRSARRQPDPARRGRASCRRPTPTPPPPQGAPTTFGGFLEHVVPQSFFEAAARNEVLQVVFWATLFAIALTQVTRPAQGGDARLLRGAGGGDVQVRRHRHAVRPDRHRRGDGGDRGPQRDRRAREPGQAGAHALRRAGRVHAGGAGAGGAASPGSRIRAVRARR